MGKGPSLAELDRAILERSPDSLYRFVKLAWHIIEPGHFEDNWHLPVVCEYLQAVTTGDILRLVINEPPGCMKSLVVSVFWPAWEWAVWSGATKFMYASYEASLSRRDGARTLRLIESPWYRSRFPAVQLREDAPAAADFENMLGGFRFSTSVGGKATGRHVDIQVVDDPTKPKDTVSSTARKALEATSIWWKGTMATRRVNPETFRRVIVMQRLHENDLAGEMLREGGWTHLCLPMRKKRTVCVCLNPSCTPEDARDYDELLWPKRFPENVVKEMEIRELGPSVAAAQLQQEPTPGGGSIFHKDWFRYWHTLPNMDVPSEPEFPCRDEKCTLLPKAGVWFQSWDMTFKGTDGTDFVAGGVWLYAHPNYYLVYQKCERMSFIESCQAVLDMTKRYPLAFTKLIEDKANGPAVENALNQSTPGMVMRNPEGGKEARAHACSGLFQAGNIYVPHPSLAPWVHDYRVQLTTFPRGVNDDMVDQTTQALIYMQQQQMPLVAAMQVISGQLSRETAGTR